MKEIFDVFRSSVLAGCCIGLGGYVYLTVGSLGGAVLFAFGLLAVITYGFYLFTGKAGFFSEKKSIAILFTAILLGNVVGCYLMSLLASEVVLSGASAIVSSRLSAGLLQNFLLAIPCGFIMTTAVKSATYYIRTEPNYYPLLIGVPLFIMCSFRHCIADAFYICCCPELWCFELLFVWVAEVVGNYIGCNLHRWVMWKEHYKSLQ